MFDSFLSPRTNRRDDELAGDLAARLTFPRSVVRAVRAAVGPEFIVGLRLGMEEGYPEGLQFDEALAALRCFIDDGIDFLSVIKGSIESDAALTRVIPSMGTPIGPHLDFVGRVRASVDIPIMHAARISDVATARYAVREGILDLVGLTRPQMADPHLVAKVARGEEDRVRPCVGASYCLDAIYQAGDAKCIHNAATGRELTLSHSIRPSTGRRRRAVVVGAGPAGLEAARVLGERGHSVVLLEAADEPGGQVRLAATNPRRRELLGLVDWRVSEAQHLGVDVRTRVFAERDTVLAEEPDLVVVATGGTPNRSFLALGEELVHDTWDVMDGSLRAQGEVLVYDDNGAEPGLDAAEMLATCGASVEVVTPERWFAPMVGGMNAPAYLKAFAERGVTITVAWQLRAVARTPEGRLRATLFNEYAEIEAERVVDHVVVEHGTLPQDELYLDLVSLSSNAGEVDQRALLEMRPQQILRNPEGRFQLFRIGDAVASRNIHAAVYDAQRLCEPF